MAENYILFPEYLAHSATVNALRIGYSRADTLKDLTFGTAIDDTELKSLHLADDSTDYQNTTGRTVYAVITMNAFVDTGDRRYKIWSAPTTDSKSGATEVFDSNDIHPFVNWDSSGDAMTSRLVPISNNHYIVVENVSGSSTLRMSFLRALVLEPSV